MNCGCQQCCRSRRNKPPQHGMAPDKAAPVLQCKKTDIIFFSFEWQVEWGLNLPPPPLCMYIVCLGRMLFFVVRLTFEWMPWIRRRDKDTEVILYVVVSHSHLIEPQIQFSTKAFSLSSRTTTLGTIFTANTVNDYYVVYSFYFWLLSFCVLASCANQNTLRL